MDVTTTIVTNQLSSVTQKLESGLGISEDDDKARVSACSARFPRGLIKTLLDCCDESNPVFYRPKVSKPRRKQSERKS